MEHLKDVARGEQMEYLKDIKHGDRLENNDLRDAEEKTKGTYL